MSDIIRVHQKFTLSGDRTLIQSFRAALGNPRIAKHITSSLTLPTFIAQDLVALELETRLSDGDISTIHARLDMSKISESLHIDPKHAADMQHTLYNRLLQRVLQRHKDSAGTSETRASVLELFGKFSPGIPGSDEVNKASGAADVTGTGTRDEEEDLFGSIFLADGADVDVDQEDEMVPSDDPLSPAVRTAVEEPTNTCLRLSLVKSPVRSQN